MNKALLKRYRILLGKVVEKIFTFGKTKVELRTNAEAYTDLTRGIRMDAQMESVDKAMPQKAKSETELKTEYELQTMFCGREQKPEDTQMLAEGVFASETLAKKETVKKLGEILIKSQEKAEARKSAAIKGNGQADGKARFNTQPRSANAAPTESKILAKLATTAYAAAFGLRFSTGNLLIRNKSAAEIRKAKALDGEGVGRIDLKTVVMAKTEKETGFAELSVGEMEGSLFGSGAKVQKSTATDKSQLEINLAGKKKEIERATLNAFEKLAENCGGAKEVVKKEEMQIVQRDAGSLLANIWECPYLADGKLYIRQSQETENTAKGLVVR